MWCVEVLMLFVCAQPAPGNAAPWTGVSSVVGGAAPLGHGSFAAAIAFATAADQLCDVALQASIKRLEKEIDDFKFRTAPGNDFESKFSADVASVQQVSKSVVQYEQQLADLVKQAKDKKVKLATDYPLPPVASAADDPALEACAHSPDPAVRKLWEIWNYRRRHVYIIRQEVKLFAYMSQLDNYNASLKRQLVQLDVPPVPLDKVVAVKIDGSWPLAPGLSDFYVRNPEGGTEDKILGWYVTKRPVEAGGTLVFKDFSKGEWNIFTRVGCVKLLLANVKWNDKTSDFDVKEVVPPQVADANCYALPLWVYLSPACNGCIGGGAAWGFVDYGCCGRVWAPMGHAGGSGTDLPSGAPIWEDVPVPPLVSIHSAPTETGTAFVAAKRSFKK